ncbi:C25 family cysteine peptidase [Hymenobacter caeli]|uniref:Gingipain domain-containing protein n=1 Tax=Hymenobacter caeli TaxID=2735894 RepID=A0ABX2FQH1_9BACT|nr:C25 family cysteine peptidase [Hymenobacter caeli]NRT19407.1 hypothetical protein [Hymenobacter caeli]
MKRIDTRELLHWGALVWLLALLGSGAARAQSGPYGNEWIVPGQPYYKIKITQDALYRLDYQYLTKAGLSGIDPSRLQLWRRGKELAVYQGGTPTTFDASTYLEFYGQRNDGALDRGLYKTPADQPHQLYSFYTDTAAYFLTYPGPGGRLGKRMAESQSAGGGTPQAWWLFTAARAEASAYTEAPNGSTYLPWLESGEGFYSPSLTGSAGTYDDGIYPLLAVLPTGPAPAPVIELGLTGGTLVPHSTEILVNDNPTNRSSVRSLGSATYKNYENIVKRFTLKRSDVAPNGGVIIRLSGPATGTTSTSDYFHLSYLKAVAPQATRWLNVGPQPFRNDSTLSTPATFEVDSIPATARGYDIHDPWNVQRIAPAAALTLGALGRRFVFTSTAGGQSRRLLLADPAAAAVPAAPQRLVFRNLNAKATFAIVTHPQVYGASKAPRLYAGYRASAAGGGYDTLVVTAPQLYDQFHYGERSWLALRHFGLWLVNGNPTNPNRYLLLLGKGIVPSDNSLYSYRTHGENGVDLVPTSSRSVSDNMITADFYNGDYRAKLRTGRLTVVNEQQVLVYLAKLREHEALGLAPWRKNVLHLVGGTNQTEGDEFRAIMDRSKVRAQQPLFGGTVTTREIVSQLPVAVNIATELNGGLSLITYFGHGSNNHFLLDFLGPSDASNGYTNAGKYPMLFLNGCAGNHTFTPSYTRVEDWLFTPSAGALGSLGEYGFSYSDRLEISQDSMYRLLFNDPNYYGQPITAVHDELVRRLQKTPYFKDDIGIEQLLATGWQGDPTLALYAPPKPDFVASNGALSVSSANPPAEVTAGSATFLLNIGVSNPGKITRDKVEVRVTRHYDGTGGTRPDDVYTQVFPQAFRRDTVYAFAIPNTVVAGVNVFGNNLFTVELDYQKKVAELDETNNIATLSYTFLQGGVTVLSPPEFAVVPTNAPRLVAQTNDPNGPARLFNAELDTTAAFNSPLVQRTNITAPLLVSWRPTLPAVGRDSVVWYWRVRFAAAGPGEDARWATSSFRVINGLSGWSQSHYAQLQRDNSAGVSVAGPNGRWAFDPQTTRATITSTRIGPAQEWKTLLHQVAPGSPTGNFKLRLLGIDAAGNVKELKDRVPSSRFSLAGISATDYPYLQLELSVADTNRVAPQLREWLVAYTGVPEGIVRRDLVPAATYDPATLLQQATTKPGTLAFPVLFENVSALPFGTPLVVKAEVFDSNTNTRVAGPVLQTVTTPLLPNAILTQNVSIPVTGKFGNLYTKVTFNPLPQAPTDPQALPELTHVNNELNLSPFKVGDTTVPPVLDVAFDGRHILNGEIVSPRPVVSIQLTDTDKLRPLADASAFTVYLQAGTAQATAVNVLGADATFRVETTAAGSTAYLDYSPGRANPLPDGNYTLRVQGRNASNLSAAAQEFQVKFTVVNASKITNLYPYPNPVTSKARFVFTLTGQELPRNMKIQIMTLTGRVVREIFMGELGNIHIGNNLTDFAWDGTDQYGDRLANGTYLYRVSLDDPGSVFSRQATSGDQAFKNDWGKLVLLR